MSHTAVVILNYNGEKYLRQFLPSVVANSVGADVVVADNGSTDSSIQILRREFPTVKVLELQENYGFCGGYNRALKLVTADYYVLLNSDVEVTPGWLQPLQHILDTHAEVAAVQPKILSYHNKNLFEYAGAAGGFIDSLGYPFCRGRLFDVTEEDVHQYNDDKEIFWATGACMMVRSQVYHQAGGLDEDFFAHMEEIDLCWRMKRNGHRILYTGASTVFHVGGGTLSKLSPTKTYLNFRNGLYLLLKNLTLSELLWKIPLRVLLDYVAGLKFLLDGQYKHSFAVLKAHYHVLLNLAKAVKRNAAKAALPSAQLTGVYRGSVVWDFFIKGKKKIDV